MVAATPRKDLLSEVGEVWKLGLPPGVVLLMQLDEVRDCFISSLCRWNLVWTNLLSKEHLRNSTDMFKDGLKSFNGRGRFEHPFSAMDHRRWFRFRQSQICVDRGCSEGDGVIFGLRSSPEEEGETAFLDEPKRHRGRRGWEGQRPILWPTKTWRSRPDPGRLVPHSIVWACRSSRRLTKLRVAPKPPFVPDSSLGPGLLPASLAANFLHGLPPQHSPGRPIHFQISRGSA